jgi:hypothetical protein
MGSRVGVGGDREMKGRHAKSGLEGILRDRPPRPFLFYLKKRYSSYSQLFKLTKAETAMQELGGK